MNMHRITIAAASVAFFLGTSSLATQAAEVKAGVGGVNATVSVGGKSTAGAKASVGNAANATTTVGGGGGNVSSTTATVGNNNATANVGTGNGPLVDSDTNSNSLTEGVTSDTDVNLGGLFGGDAGPDDGDGNGNGGGNAGGGNGGTGNGVPVPDSVQAAIAGMSDGEIATMKRRCNGILAMPTGYDQGILDLCRVLRSL